MSRFGGIARVEMGILSGMKASKEAGGGADEVSDPQMCSPIMDIST